MIKNNIEKKLSVATSEYLKREFDDEKILKKLEVKVEAIRDYSYGDYAGNVAMILAGQLKKSPMEIAGKIVEILRKKQNEQKKDVLEKIEAVAPGYINFYLSQKFFTKQLSGILEKENDWGRLDDLRGKKYLVEHSSPNLFKPFHIGHLVNNSIGESLTRLFENAGATVKKVSFPSDVSPGIAKTVWAIKQKKWKEITIEKIGKAYAFGVKKYNEDEQARKEIDEINENIYLGKNFDGQEIYCLGYEKSLNYFKKVVAELGTKFDELIFESEAEKVGKEIVYKNIPKVFVKSKGAIIFPGSKFGLYDNVFINSAGFGTYLTKDIGLLKIKFERFKFDRSVTITDVEQREHFQLVKAVAERIEPLWAERSEFVQHGRLRFAGGKVSSRFGNVPLAEDVIASVKKKIKEKISRENSEIKEENLEDNLKKISIGALKYSILKSSAGKNIVFDFEKSISFEGNSGPYLQYTYVRTCSLLRKMRRTEKIKVSQREGGVLKIEKMLLRFPEAIENSLRARSPHYLATFLFELSAEFNSFYGKERILDEKNRNYDANIALTKMVNITLRKGLHLLGIEAPDKM